MPNVRNEIIHLLEDMMSKYTLKIWGREFEVDINFETFGREVDDIQIETINNIEKVNFGSQETIARIINYIVNDYSDIETDVDSINLFKYLIPKKIYVPKLGKRIFAILFNYRFDEEHGFALVYENEALTDIGSEDIIL